MKVAILGYGEQGRSAYEYWHSTDNEITVCDQNESAKLPKDVQKRLGSDYLKGLDQFDMIVRSPSVHPSDIVAANSVSILEKVTTVTNEFFEVCPTKNIIGVTGTKGKGTTCTLIAKMLEASGKKTHLGGNIGIPPLDLLKNSVKPDDWVVLELANFQLIDIKYSPPIAVCLMVADEHLDWHADSNEYITAKQQLFRWQGEQDIAIYYAENDYSQHITSISKGQKIPYMKHPGADVIEKKIVVDGQIICDVSELKLLGKHNWQNVCASVTAVWPILGEVEWQISQAINTIQSVLTTFTGLEHRLELVRELDGVKYYDDSFGTVPETAIVAIEAFDRPKVVILGGSDKGSDYKQLAKTVKEHNVRKVLVIGKMAEKISQELRDIGFTDIEPGGDNMEAIVTKARSSAQPGDVVLLSTACASFGMFENYKDRGEQFQKVVNALQ